MKNRKISLDEFRAQFSESFGSESEMLDAFQAFQRTVEQLEEIPVSQLSATDKGEVFRHAWQQRSPMWSLEALLGLLQRPTVTFTMGLALGCVLMFFCLSSVKVTPESQSSPMLTVERMGSTQTYSGETVQKLYPQIENPKLVVEKSDESSSPKRVVYGTLDDGNIQVLWNL